MHKSQDSVGRLCVNCGDDNTLVTAHFIFYFDMFKIACFVTSMYAVFTHSVPAWLDRLKLFVYQSFYPQSTPTTTTTYYI
jgi:hypothetical protein